MESKFLIDLDLNNEERILIRWASTDDLRDKITLRLIEKALPLVLSDQSFSDGYCRISVIGRDQDRLTIEIVPITPYDMPKHIKEIQENAAKYEANKLMS